MRALRAGVLLLVVAALAACGGSGHARRDAVNAYFDRVDRAQDSLLASAGDIDIAFQNFKAAGNSHVEIRRLELAETKLRTTLRRVRAIAPPREAAQVHSDLVALLSLESGVAHELVQITRYEPQFVGALVPLRADAARLARDVAAAGKQRPVLKASNSSALDAYADAFARYGSALADALAKLDRLDAPPLLRPTLVDEQRTLRRGSALCRSIARALRKNDLATANAGVRTLFAATSSATAAAAQHAAAAAVGGYQARLRKIAALEQKIARERQQLVQRVG